MDYVVWCHRRPDPGATLLGTRFEQHPGGKGLNQALATRRLGAQTVMLGAAGQDEAGDALVSELEVAGCDVAGVLRTDAARSGAGFPMVTDDGDVSIVMVPGANHLIRPADVDRALEGTRKLDVLLMQGEIPLEASARAAELAAARGAKVVCNPAPAGDGVEVLLESAWAVIPNESELCALTGTRGVGDHDELVALARSLLFGTIQVAIVTLGGGGALAVDRHEAWRVDAHTVEVVDPTGAGDAFCAAAGVALAENRPLPDVLAFANAAGAVAVQVAGAAPSMPTRGRVEQLLASPAAPTVAAVERVG